MPAVRRRRTTVLRRPDVPRAERLVQPGDVQLADVRRAGATVLQRQRLRQRALVSERDLFALRRLRATVLRDDLQRRAHV
jgi:hypothetical protein